MHSVLVPVFASTTVGQQEWAAPHVGVVCCLPQATDFGLSSFFKPGQRLSDVVGTAFYMVRGDLIHTHRFRSLSLQHTPPAARSLRSSLPACCFE